MVDMCTGCQLGRSLTIFRSCLSVKYFTFISVYRMLDLGKEHTLHLFFTQTEEFIRAVVVQPFSFVLNFSGV